MTLPQHLKHKWPILVAVMILLIALLIAFYPREDEVPEIVVEYNTEKSDSLWVAYSKKYDSILVVNTNLRSKLKTKQNVIQTKRRAVDNIRIIDEPDSLFRAIIDLTSPKQGLMDVHDTLWRDTLRPIEVSRPDSR